MRLRSQGHVRGRARGVRGPLQARAGGGSRMRDEWMVHPLPYAEPFSVRTNNVTVGIDCYWLLR